MTFFAISVMKMGRYLVIFVPIYEYSFSWNAYFWQIHGSSKWLLTFTSIFEQKKRKEIFLGKNAGSRKDFCSTHQLTIDLTWSKKTHEKTLFELFISTIIFKKKSRAQVCWSKTPAQLLLSSQRPGWQNLCWVKFDFILKSLAKFFP